jgi:hypothetical protein
MRLPPEDEPKFIVFKSCLEELIKFCPQCGSPVVDREQFATGSMISYRIRCHEGHELTWNSQPKANRQPLGNVLIAASTLFNGLTHTRLAEWAKAMNLLFIGKDTYNKLQKDVLFPTVQEAWKAEKKRAISVIKKQKGGATLAGDCRCDSPGHSAKYGSYSLMNISPKAPQLIATIQLVDVTEVRFSEPHSLESH